MKQCFKCNKKELVKSVGGSKIKCKKTGNIKFPFSPCDCEEVTKN